MDTGSAIAAASLGAGLVGALLVYMIRIEHRMTKLETLIMANLKHV